MLLPVGAASSRGHADAAHVELKKLAKTLGGWAFRWDLFVGAKSGFNSSAISSKSLHTCNDSIGEMCIFCSYFVAALFKMWSQTFCVSLYIFIIFHVHIALRVCIGRVQAHRRGAPCHAWTPRRSDPDLPGTKAIWRWIWQ